MKHNYALLLLALAVTSATAASTTYNVDPDHTHPSFEVDHFGGLSTWRGTFKKSSGTVTLDTEAKTGTVDVVSIPQPSISPMTSSTNMYRAPRCWMSRNTRPRNTKENSLNSPMARQQRISGDLTLHGITKPVTLTINSFKCFEHPMLKKQVCGADASGSFNRADFGVNYGQQYGFKQDVLLRIQVEGVKVN